MNTTHSKLVPAALLAALGLGAPPASAVPRAVVISLDGASPRFVDAYLASGVLDPNEGIGLLKSKGFSARQNITVTPSLTAPGHIAIATGSSASSNNVIANSFHLVASPFNLNISGFGAPIGGYCIDCGPNGGPGMLATPTAQPVWVSLLQAGRTVAAATWPGADGVNVRVPGDTNQTVVQDAAERTVTYTIPFGAFAGQGARGFSLVGSDFSLAPAATVAQLNAAGRTFFGLVMQKTTELENLVAGGATNRIQVAALDTSNDGAVNYDTLVFFNAATGIPAVTPPLPATGPAYVKASDKRSSPYFIEGSPAVAGTAFYVSQLAPDLSGVRICRYAANSIPRNPPVLGDVDDANANVGFWAPQPDFRIPERLSPGFGPFPDAELEDIYADQVDTFTDYQARLGLRAIAKTPDADLVMIYFEQPDGSFHQFLLTDPRQPTDFTNPNSIGPGQDPAKVARYQGYLARAYQAADAAVQRIIDAVGTDANGVPRSNLFVVSDHGFETFHTAVSMAAFLTANGMDATKVRAVTSGPAVNLYINLQGREPNGTVNRAEYLVLQRRLRDLLQAFQDTNPTYTLGAPRVAVFDKIYQRPPPPAGLNDPRFGRTTSKFIAQDSGDVVGILRPGYNFDGVQNPVVRRQGDPAAGAPVLSVPNFYGAHGYDPLRPNLSAVFYAAGPDIGQGVLNQMRNIDIAPTLSTLLGVPSVSTVEGQSLPIFP